jgi:hypothetical protein
VTKTWMPGHKAGHDEETDSRKRVEKWISI